MIGARSRSCVLGMRGAKRIQKSGLALVAGERALLPMKRGQGHMSMRIVKLLVKFNEFAGGAAQGEIMGRCCREDKGMSTWSSIRGRKVKNLNSWVYGTVKYEDNKTKRRLSVPAPFMSNAQRCIHKRSEHRHGEDHDSIAEMKDGTHS